MLSLKGTAVYQVVNQFFKPMKKDIKKDNTQKQRKSYRKGKKLESPNILGGYDNEVDLSYYSEKTGENLNDVQVHFNSQKARGIGSKAFAHGNDIHFSDFNKGTNNEEQQRILSHELVHILHQRKGKVNYFDKDSAEKNYNHLENDANSKGAALSRGQSISVGAAGTKASPVMQMWGYKDRGWKFWKDKEKEKQPEEIEMTEIGHGAHDDDEAQQQAERPSTDEVFKKHYGDGGEMGMKKVNDLAAVADKEKNTIDAAKGIGGGAYKTYKGISQSKHIDQLTANIKNPTGISGFGQGNEMGIGTASLGGAVSLGMTGKSTYGAYKDKSQGKFTKSKGGKGNWAVMRSMGRGMKNLGSMAASGLSITQNVAKGVGNAGLYSAMGKAIPGLGIATGAMDFVSGAHRSILAHGRKKSVDEQLTKMKDEKGGGNQDHIDAFQHISEIQSKRRNKGIKDMALGAGSAVAAGLMLNPLTAPAGLVLGGALALGAGGHALYKKIRQNRRDKYAQAITDSGKTADELNQERSDKLTQKASYSGYNPLKWARGKIAKRQLSSMVENRGAASKEKIDELKSTYKQDSGWNPLKKFKSWRAGKELEKLDYGEAKLAKAEKTKESYDNMGERWRPDLKKSTQAKNERYSKTAGAIMSMENKEQQHVALKALGLNKHKKNEDGSFSDERNEYYNNQLKSKKSSITENLEGGELDKRRRLAIENHTGEFDKESLDGEVENQVSDEQAEKELLMSKLKKR